MSSLRLVQALPKELRHAEAVLGRPVDPGRVAILDCDTGRHLIVAAKVIVRESQMDIFESPFK
jgi:hypothetical protein